MSTKQGTANQGDSEGGESLILGKYKTNEEAFAALEQAEKEKNDLKEALDREQRLNQLLDSVRDEPKKNSVSDDTGSDYQYSDLFEDEAKSKKFQEVLQSREQAIWQRVGSLVESKVLMQEARRNANEQFYKKYPELKDFSHIVDSHATTLGKELGAKSANVPFEKLAAEVASRTKGEISELKKKLTKNSLYVESGGSSEPSFGDDEKVSKVSSEEERSAKYFQDEVKARNDKKNAVFGSH